MENFYIENKLNISFSDLRILNHISKEDCWINKLLSIRGLFDFNNRINILLFDSIEELSRYLGGKVPSWVIGSYIGSSILMLNYDIWKERELGPFMQVMVHEFAHIAIGQVSKLRCPIWLNEGLALYFAEQYRTVRLDTKCISKANIYEFNYSDGDVYDICAKAIEKLVDLYGIDTIIDRLRHSSAYEKDEILGITNMEKILESLRNNEKQAIRA